MGIAAGAIMLCLVASGCSQTTARPSPITRTEQTKLEQLAAGPDAPEGLGEALAGIEANRQRQACQDKVAGVAQQMKVMGVVSSAVGVAGRMAGTGGKAASKAFAVGSGKVIRGQVRQLRSC